MKISFNPNIKPAKINSNRIIKKQCLQNASDTVSFSSKISTREDAAKQLILKGKFDEAYRVHGIEESLIREILPHMTSDNLYSAFMEQDSLVRFPDALSQLAIDLIDEDKIKEAVWVYDAIPDDYEGVSDSNITYYFGKEAIAQKLVEKLAKNQNSNTAHDTLEKYFLNMLV